jgi:hypothetical protein
LSAHLRVVCSSSEDDSSSLSLSLSLAPALILAAELLSLVGRYVYSEETNRAVAVLGFTTRPESPPAGRDNPPPAPAPADRY